MTWFVFIIFIRALFHLILIDSFTHTIFIFTSRSATFFLRLLIPCATYVLLLCKIVFKILVLLKRIIHPFTTKCIHKSHTFTKWKSHFQIKCLNSHQFLVNSCLHIWFPIVLAMNEMPTIRKFQHFSNWVGWWRWWWWW